MIYDYGIAEGFISKIEETVENNMEALYKITAYIVIMWSRLTNDSAVMLNVSNKKDDEKLFFGMYKAGNEYNDSDSDFDFYNFHQGYIRAFKELYSMPLDDIVARIAEVNKELENKDLNLCKSYVSSLWHDVEDRSIRCDNNEDIVLLLENGKIVEYDDDWEDYCCLVLKWAYKKDIIPN